MSDIEEAPRTYSGALLAAIAIALLAAVGSLVWCFTLTSKLSTAQAELADSKQQDTQMAAELRETNARLKVATDELGKSVGLTQKELDERAQAIVRARKPMRPPKSKRRSKSTHFYRPYQRKDGCGRCKTDLTKTQGDLANTNQRARSPSRAT